MADGRTHAVVSLVSAGTIFFLTRGALGEAASVQIAAGCVSGIFLTPDLDQFGISASEWWIVKYIPIIGWSWLAGWDPYARLISHRHWLSHLPILGTVLRVVYLAGLVWVVSSLLKYNVYDWFVAIPASVIFYWVCGLIISDTGHWIWDGFPM